VRPRAVGRERFEAFVTQVGRQIGSGKRSLGELEGGGGTMSEALSADRRRAMLRTAMGPTIAAALADPAVIEIMVNPDGALRLDRLGEGRTDTGTRYDPRRSSGSSAWSPATREPRCTRRRRSSPPNCRRMVRAPASGSKACCRPCRSRPASRSASPPKIYTLLDYVSDGIMPADRRGCCAWRSSIGKNILVAGGTSSGKTTLANALLAEMAHLDERVILIEDTRELQCAAPTSWRCAPGPAWCHGRSGPLDAAPAARPHHRRRSARRRGARHAQGLEHRPSRRHRHRPRQQRVAALYRLEQLVQETSSPCRAG
jgi:hypothetical protein